MKLLQRILSILAVLAIGTGFALAMSTEPDAVQGEFARVFHVHVPSAWLAFLAFGVTLAGSIGWLIWRKPLADHTAAASAEIGVFFTGLAIITGMIWGYPVWGVAWDWGDARLVSTAVMFFVYVGYLALRRAIPDPVVRATRSAVLGSLAFLLVPAVYFSVELFRTLHQGMTITPQGSSMSAEMLVAFLVNLLAFTILYLAFLVSRTRLSFARAALSIGRTPSDRGDVEPPDLEAIRD